MSQYSQEIIPPKSKFLSSIQNVWKTFRIRSTYYQNYRLLNFLRIRWKISNRQGNLLLDRSSYFASENCSQSLSRVSKCPWYQINLSIVVSFPSLCKPLYKFINIWLNMDTYLQIIYLNKYNLTITQAFLIWVPVCLSKCATSSDCRPCVRQFVFVHRSLYAAIFFLYFIFDQIVCLCKCTSLPLIVGHVEADCFLSYKLEN